MTNRKRNIVIVGGGIIGSTTAYFLTRHKSFDPELHTITILEATSVAAGASGKAGGLLALWAYPECLVRLSFELHAKLAAEHDGANKWGYRKLKCGSVSATVTREKLAAISGTCGKRKRELEAEDLEEAAAASRVPASPVTDVTENGVKAGTQSVVESLIEAHDLDGLTNETKSTKGEADSQPPQSQEWTEGKGKAPVGKEVGRTAQENEPEERKDEEIVRKKVARTEKEKEIDRSSEQKHWEKLPKQDEAAAALLEESPLPNDLTWIDPTTIEGYAEMGTPTKTDTAQVHPFHFTTSIAALAEQAGVKIKTMTRVTKILASKTTLEGIEYVNRQTGDPHILTDVTDVVVCAGPWTGKLVPRAKVEGLRAHSVVWEADVSPYAVFTDIDLPEDYLPDHRARMGQKKRHKGRVDPEIYARPFGEVYACGEPDSTVPLPETADQVQIDQVHCDDLIAYSSTISPQLRDAPIKAKQSCYLPRHMRFGNERGPLIGPTSVAGLWIASGHTCWGIQNGPATGYLMAQYLLEGVARGAKVDKLDPRKFKV